ncbi:hypothetical protein HKX48_008453 [Thoreauomyces humboldtii]|nr:hypothetical protein HKX48_008453 [Thoreauomyces humboldtii]
MQFLQHLVGSTADGAAPALPPRPPLWAPTENSGPADSATGGPPLPVRPGEEEYQGPCLDVTFNFHRAQHLPKMDLIGSADPFFRATLSAEDVNGKIDYCSTCISNTRFPEWNETWVVHRVPVGAVLSVQVYDKDVHYITDDLIGTCKMTIEAGEHDLPIVGTFGRHRGGFLLGVSTLPTAITPPNPLYVFAGPTRYTIHRSPLVGALTRLNEENLYSTWKIHLTLVQVYLPHPTHWNESYKAAQTIFQGPLSITVRAPIHQAHKLLYARTWGNGFGTLSTGKDFLDLLMSGEKEKRRGETRMYTYIIDDSTMRFSETGAAFLVDFASKHALHSNCSEFVRYAGEFHLRPFVSTDGNELDRDGWANFTRFEEDALEHVKWQLVIDNNSGTYAPPKEALPALEKLLRHNFPGLALRALDREDPFLITSRDEMKAYAAARGTANVPPSGPPAAVPPPVPPRS